MKELQLGKIKTVEMYDWFGMSRNTFKKREEEYLLELKEYCDYELVYGGFIIKKIYKPRYINKKDKVWRFFSTKVNDFIPQKEPFTSSDITEELCLRYEDEKRGYSNGYIYGIVLEARDILYGNPKYMGLQVGELGISQYVLCTRDKETNKLRFLTEEEEELKKKLLIKHFNTSQEKVAILQDMVNKGEILKEEFYDYYTKVALPKCGGYGAFFQEMKDNGVIIIRATVVERSGFIHLEEVSSIIENAFAAASL